MVASGAIKASRGRCWERRKQRFADVVCAIDSLIDWLKLENDNLQRTSDSHTIRRKGPRTYVCMYARDAMGVICVCKVCRVCMYACMCVR